MSRSPETTEVTPAALRPYEDSWTAIYNLIDEGAGWSGQERNCFFLNTRSPAFANASASTGMDFEDDGRAVALTDWDFDGRLDCWVVNRTAPRLRLLRNVSATRQHFIALHLRGTRSNRDAIGARIEVTPTEGRPIIRTLRAGEGYLSQSSKAIHIGLGADPGLTKLTVQWPGGKMESFTGVTADAAWVLVEGEGQAEPWKAPRGAIDLAPGSLEVPTRPGASRTWLGGRVLFPAQTFAGWDASERRLMEPSGRPVLINLWSRTCGPCLEEFAEWKAEAAALERAGVRVLALCVDESDDDRRAAATYAASLAFTTGVATDEVKLAFETVSRAYLESRRPLPVPTSLLLDENGLVAALYKGRVSAARLMADVELLRASPNEQRAAALPFPGRWNSPPLAPNPRLIIGTLMKAGHTQAALTYTERCLDPLSPLRLPDATRASLTLFRGDLDLDAGELDRAVEIYRRLFDLAARNPAIHREVAIRLVTKQRVAEALRHLELAVSLDPNHADSRLNLASLLLRLGQSGAALEHFLELAHQRPDVALVRLQVARLLQEQGRIAEAIPHFQAAQRLNPGSPATPALAWLRATHRDPAMRDTAEAVRLAELAAQGAGRDDPQVLTILAAAYAEAGRFPEAVAAAERAQAGATAAGHGALAQQLARHIERLRAGEPIRE
ncbi:MAG: ASPIC/UnbV domain-containing protein [Verrucomicrobiales bacterium]